MRKGNRKRVLLVVRHPVGGILTFFKYMYGQDCFDEYNFTVIAPEPDLRETLERIFNRGDFNFIPCVGSKDMVRISWMYLKNNCVCLVHTHGFTAGSLLVPVTSLNKVPHLMTTHDIFQESQFSGLRGKIKKYALSYVFDKIDTIHTVGFDATENLQEYFPSVEKNKIHCIPNGIDTEKYYDVIETQLCKDYKKEVVFLIGFFGRFMPQKGFRDLVDAIDNITRNKLSDQTPLVLTYGWGGFIREEYQLIEDRGLSSYFRMMPFTDNMPVAIKGVNLVVMPSLWEALPLLGMEVLVAGVPIIGTNCIGLKEVLKGSPGVMVPINNSEMLAAAIADEMNSSSLQVFQQYSHIAKKRFSLEEPSLELKMLYERTITI